MLRKEDVIVLGGVELHCDTLRAMIDPEARLLWGFVRNDLGDIMAVPYTENQLIWLDDKDLERTDVT